MGKSIPTEAAPAYDDLFHEQGTSSRNGYAVVEQTDVEQGHHHQSDPVELAPTAGQDQHSHCAECDRQRERREKREGAQRSCGMVAKTFILIALFMMILGVVSVQAWKDVRMNKGHK